MTAFPTYSTGTVAVANGATAITGTGTNWTGANAKPGDDIVVDGHTVVVLDVTDATHLVIDAWPFTSVVAGASYKIIKRSPLRFVGGDAMADVSTLVAALNTDGFYVFVASTLIVPDPSYGNDNQFAFQPSTSKLWLKTGGVWVLQGIYKGFNIIGAWSGATAYAVNDVVSLSGSSYTCILAHTNHTPPNATYWVLLASIGNTGSTGATGAGYGGTSTTSLAIGTGSKAFTTQAGLAYTNGARVRASSAANTSNWMEGLVTYSGTTLTMTADKTNGSGTLADWNLNVVGQPGAGDLTAANNGSDFANVSMVLRNIGATGIGRAINGLIPANNATTPNTKIDISPGSARDKDLTVDIFRAIGITKTTAAWAAGNDAGAIDTGSLAVSTGYHIHAIYMPGTTPTAWVTTHAYVLTDTVTNASETFVCVSAHTSGTFATDLAAGKWKLQVDILFSTSATAPTMPSGYTKRRRIGGFITDASGFIYKGLWRGNGSFELVQPITVISARSLTNQSLLTWPVPLGVKVNLKTLVSLTNTTGGNPTFYGIMRDPDIGVLATDGTQWQASHLLKPAGINSAQPVECWTNTSGQVYTWSYSGDANNQGYYYLLGWTDLRDEFS